LPRDWGGAGPPAPPPLVYASVNKIFTTDAKRRAVPMATNTIAPSHGCVSPSTVRQFAGVLWRIKTTRAHLMTCVTQVSTYVTAAATKGGRAGPWERARG